MAGLSRATARSSILPAAALVVLAGAAALTSCKKGEAPEVVDGAAPPAGADEIVDTVPADDSAPADDTSPAPPPAPVDAGSKAADVAAPVAELNALAEKLDEFAREKKGRARVAVYDLARSAWVVEWSADEVENPASTQKVLTAAAALELLGPAHTFRTEILGKQSASGDVERLVFKGGGAPDFTTSDLWRLSRVVVESGVKKVGSILVDQSRFDDHFVPPAFEQQPNEWAAFRAPVSALALDRNTVTLQVLPTEKGKPARVWYEPPGAVVGKGSVETGATDVGDRVGWTLLPTSGQPLTSTVAGALAEGSGRHRYSRRLDDPRLVPGYALRELLMQQGVTVSGDVKLGEDKSAPRLVHLESAPLGEIVRALGKESDNFTAEMLLIALGQLEGSGADVAQRPWSTARGLVVLEKWLKDRALVADGLQLKNGSGLFDANRLSPRILARVLRLMLDRPGVYAEFLGQLALGGQDGTLKHRFEKGALAGRVRAKTGTLKDVTALAGYVLRADGRPPLVFAFLVSGVAGRHDEARRRIDRTLGSMAQTLGL